MVIVTLKHMRPGVLTIKPAPWHEAARRDGFIEALENKGYSPEQIKEAYETYFGEKFGYKLD